MATRGPGAGSRGIPLEHILGPTEDRYFAAGYRGVRHTTHASDHSESDPDMRQAWGRVVYPARWSIDADGRPRTTHLSSVDAIVLPLLAWQDAAPAGDDRDVVRTVALRAGNEPWTALDRIPIRSRRHVDADRVALSSTVGNLRSVIQIAHAAPVPRRISAASPARVYAELYRLIQTESTLSGFDADGHVLESRHVAHAPEPRAAAVTGLEAAFWPSLTAIDYLVTMGQLTQATIFAVSRSTRSTIDNLWMRTLHLSLPERPSSLPAQYRATTRLIRDTPLRIAGRRVHDVRVESTTTTGVVAGATLAYTEVAP